MKKIFLLLTVLFYVSNVYGRGGSGSHITLTNASDTILLTEVDSYIDESYTWYINTGQNENIAICYIAEIQTSDILYIQEYKNGSYRTLVSINGGNGTRTGIVYTSQPNGMARILLEYGTQQHHVAEHVEIAYSSAPSSTLKNINILGYVGIGTTEPTARLHINNGALKIGSSTSQTERENNVLMFGDDSYVKIGEWERDNQLSFQASCYNFRNGNVGIGKSTPAYKLDVAGTIRSEEIIVETNGADFVFEDDYNLRPLSEVESFVQEHKHLPEIQTATEMQETGVSVSELQTQLLQKIEEITLYLILQDKEITDLKQQIEILTTN